MESLVPRRDLRLSQSLTTHCVDGCVLGVAGRSHCFHDGVDLLPVIRWVDLDLARFLVFNLPCRLADLTLLGGRWRKGYCFFDFRFHLC